MKKLVINGLLCVAFILIIAGVVSGLVKLWDIDATEQHVDTILQGAAVAVVEQKAVEEQKEVKVTVQEKEENSNPQTTNDDDVNSFLNDLG